jgi:hypothetical protein
MAATCPYFLHWPYSLQLSLCKFFVGWTHLGRTVAYCPRQFENRPAQRMSVFVVLQIGSLFMRRWKQGSNEQHGNWLSTSTIPTERNHPRELIVPQLIKILSAVCGKRKFITVFTTSRHQCFSWTRWIRPTPLTHYFFKIYFNIIVSTPPSKWSLPFRLCD